MKYDDYFGGAYDYDPLGAANRYNASVVGESRRNEPAMQRTSQLMRAPAQANEDAIWDQTDQAASTVNRPAPSTSQQDRQYQSWRASQQGAETENNQRAGQRQMDSDLFDTQQTNQFQQRQQAIQRQADRMLAGYQQMWARQKEQNAPYQPENQPWANGSSKPTANDQLNFVNNSKVNDVAFINGRWMIKDNYGFSPVEGADDEASIRRVADSRSSAQVSPWGDIRQTDAAKQLRDLGFSDEQIASGRIGGIEPAALLAQVERGERSAPRRIRTAGGYVTTSGDDGVTVSSGSRDAYDIAAEQQAAQRQATPPRQSPRQQQQAAPSLAQYLDRYANFGQAQGEDFTDWYKRLNDERLRRTDEWYQMTGAQK